MTDHGPDGPAEGAPDADHADAAPEGAGDGTGHAPGIRIRHKREARFGLAALLSFLILVVVLVLNKGHKGKTPLMEVPPGPKHEAEDVEARGEDKPAPAASGPTDAHAPQPAPGDTPPVAPAAEAETGREHEPITPPPPVATSEEAPPAPRAEVQPELPPPAESSAGPAGEPSKELALVPEPVPSAPADAPPAGGVPAPAAAPLPAVVEEPKPELPPAPPSGQETVAAEALPPMQPAGNPSTAPADLPAPAEMPPQPPTAGPNPANPSLDLEPAPKLPAEDAPKPEPAPKLPAEDAPKPEPAPKPPEPTPGGALVLLPSASIPPASSGPPPPPPTATRAPARTREVPNFVSPPAPADPVALKSANVAEGRGTWVALPSVALRRADDTATGARPLRPPGPATTPEPSVPDDEDRVETVPHVVLSGENFWTISRLYYGDGRYYLALWKANRRLVPDDPKKLRVGMTIMIPPFEALDRAAIESSRPAQPVRAVGRDAGSPRRSTEIELALPASDPLSARDDEASPDDPGDVTDSRLRPRLPVYKVRAYETLRSIARDTLGDSRRASEILEMNRNVIDDPNHLTPGQIIDLPEDAQLGRRAR